MRGRKPYHRKSSWSYSGTKEGNTIRPGLQCNCHHCMSTRQSCSMELKYLPHLSRTEQSQLRFLFSRHSRMPGLANVSKIFLLQALEDRLGSLTARVGVAMAKSDLHLFLSH